MGTRRFYCTLADRNYLVRGLALIESLERHEKNDYVLYFVCLDELSRTVLRALNLPRVVPVALHSLEKGDEALLAVRPQRSLVEYYWTLTPTLILRLIERHPEIDVLTYLDADLFFYSSPDPVFEELGEGSILIHEHRYSPELAHLEPDYGRFNVGLLCFRRDEIGLRALRWWRDRCLEWCFDRPENGKMGDQKYLDDWPQRFENLVVLQHPGAGLAPWNHTQYQVSRQGNQTPTVDGQSLVFFHFHSLVVPHPCVVVPTKHSYLMSETILRACYAEYAEALWRRGQAVTAVAPTYSFGMAQPVALDQHHAVLVREGAPVFDLGPVPLRRFRISETWHAHSGEEDPLLVALTARPIGATLKIVHQIGVQRLKRADLYFWLFPNLAGIRFFVNGNQADLQAWSAEQSADPRVRVVPNQALAHDAPVPDLLVVDAQNHPTALAGLTSLQRAQVRAIYTAFDAEGPERLEALKRSLEPELVFVAFAPLSPAEPNRGNALFVNRDAVPLLRNPG